MHLFYEIIIRLPNDVEKDCPGITDTVLEVLLHNRLELPKNANWDMELVDLSMVSMAQCLVRTIVCFWQMLNPLEDVPYYIQLEEGQCYYHLHCCLSWKACDSLVLGRYTKKLKDRIVEAVFGGIEPMTSDWFSVHKTKVGGKNKVVDSKYIETYLLPKKQREVQWAWTDLPEYKDIVLDATRRALFPVPMPVDSAEDHSGDGSSIPGPAISGSAAENYCRLVDWLVAEGITSERQWLQADKNSYRTFHANSNSSRQIKAALENAKAEMLLTKTAGDYLIGKHLRQPIDANKIFVLFCLNNYDPAIAGIILVKWCTGKWGKRNTVWFTGPASTGKTNLAEAIAHAVPLYGCVNWTNENFPFNDCVGKMLIWWEEGKMTAKIVESAKAILGGSKVRVDQKCKSSIQIEPTPVIITSNLDMTLVIDGNTVTREHTEPLQHRMWKFTFDHLLEPTWGKISKEDVMEFFFWASSQGTEVEPVFQVPKLAGGGVFPPPEIDLTEDMEESQVCSVSFDISSEIDGQQIVVRPTPKEEGEPLAADPPASATPTENPSAASSSTLTTVASVHQPENPSSAPEDQPPPPKKSRYGQRLVCLEHDLAHCHICGESQCLFTPADSDTESGEEIDLECDERLSEMSDLSDIVPPTPPSPELGPLSPPSLMDLFVNDEPLLPLRFQFP